MVMIRLSGLPASLGQMVLSGWREIHGWPCVSGELTRFLSLIYVMIACKG